MFQRYEDPGYNWPLCIIRKGLLLPKILFSAVNHREKHQKNPNLLVIEVYKFTAIPIYNK